MRGRPFSLRCPKCKAGEDYMASPRPSGENLVLLGTMVAARRGSRYTVRVWRVAHLTCGWVFWTDNLNAKALPSGTPPPGARFGPTPKAAPAGALPMREQVARERGESAPCPGCGRDAKWKPRKRSWTCERCGWTEGP